MKIILLMKKEKMKDQKTLMILVMNLTILILMILPMKGQMKNQMKDQMKTKIVNLQMKDHNHTFSMAGICAFSQFNMVGRPEKLSKTIGFPKEANCISNSC